MIIYDKQKKIELHLMCSILRNMNLSTCKCNSLKISYTYMDVWWCIYFSPCFHVSSLPNFDFAHLEEYPDNEMFHIVLWPTTPCNHIWFVQKENGKTRLLVLTLYSFLNPALSFADMFETCAFMFLTEMFLLVGWPRFVFSGIAYVVHEVLFVCSISWLPSKL